MPTINSVFNKSVWYFISWFSWVPESGIVRFGLNILKSGYLGKKSEVKFQRLVRINIMVCDQVSPLCIHSSIVISSTKVQKKATHTSSCVQIQNPNSPRAFKKPDCNREIYYEAWINMGSFEKFRFLLENFTEHFELVHTKFFWNPYKSKG